MYNDYNNKLEDSFVLFDVLYGDSLLLQQDCTNDINNSRQDCLDCVMQEVHANKRKMEIWRWQNLR